MKFSTGFRNRIRNTLISIVAFVLGLGLMVSVAHEEGELMDIRAILGNDVAIRTYREGKLPFPEGAMIGRIAWRHRI